MKIENLVHTSIEDLVSCFSQSFKDYFVKMPSDVAFWMSKFKNARVDMSLSWGVFDSDKLVAFVINAVDLQHQELTAFNTGTGILPPYRGNQLVDKMYRFGLQDLLDKGVKRCSLEVIDQNKAAIRVYERIGFRQKHKLFCYKGLLVGSEEVELHEVDLTETNAREFDQKYSWDNTTETIIAAGDSYKCFLVSKQKKEMGYFIINPTSGSIAQLEVTYGDWKYLFNGISMICNAVKINNIKEDRTVLLSYLHKLSFDNTINQMDMEWDL